MNKMESLTPARCECFCISVDLVKGNTIISGTELGKQFVLTDLCKSVGVNIFVAFLNFCRENVGKGNNVKLNWCFFFAHLSPRLKEVFLIKFCPLSINC